MTLRERVPPVTAVIMITLSRERILPTKIMCDFEYRMVIFSSTVKIELHLLKLKLKKQKERKQE
eukprot:scaffold42555_cov70-Cyclotella_meneghiniana.AAC.5